MDEKRLRELAQRWRTDAGFFNPSDHDNAFYPEDMKLQLERCACELEAALAEPATADKADAPVRHMRGHYEEPKPCNSLIGLANGLIKTLQRVPLNIEGAQVPIFLALLDAYEQGYKDGQDDPSWDAVRRFLDPDNMTEWTNLGPANFIPDAPPVDAGGRPIPEEEPVVIDVETNRRVFTDLVSNRRVTWDGEIFKKNA